MKTAFLALCALVSSTALAQGADKVSQCHGNEPFWGLSIGQDTIDFEMVGGRKMSIAKKPASEAHGTSASYIALYQGRLQQNPSAFMNVIIKRAECSDHMSDETYPYTVFVLSGNNLWEGCCAE